jgi:hypothetical protein
MAKVKELMTSLDAGDATELSPSQLRDLGVSGAQGAKQKTTLNNELEFLLERGDTGRIRCPIYFVLNQLDLEMGKKLNILLDETQISSGEIATLLQKHGFEIGHYAVQRHRRRLRNGGCRCPQ